ncbi:uncharacterized protein [Leptinotarsa decemlineata]|uniref:uncharacterized protein n=1 Tax=Leptinotarsa decemlineata TaxID=7539 RepID=UPI003D304AA0
MIGKESGEKLRKLLDTVSKNLRALEQLKQPTKHWDTLIVFLIQTKLDSVTVREWEKYRVDKDVPTLDDLKRFLKSRADFLETLESNQNERVVDKKYNKQSGTRGFHITSTENKPKCVFCKGAHYSQTCEDFLKLSVSERIERKKNSKLCTNCLRPRHYSKICRCSNCKKCNGKRHTLIHMDYTQNNTPVPISDNSQTSNNAVSHALSANIANKCVLLSTALVNIADNDSNIHTIRVLLDSGSESSFMREDTCRKLNLSTLPTNVEVCGLNRTTSYIKSKCEVNIQSQHNSFRTNIHCYVLPEITGKLPDTKISNHFRLNIPHDINLADPNFYEPSSIDMLIGADHFYSLICVGQISLGRNEPILQKTQLGWVISGPISKSFSKRVSCHFTHNPDIQNQLARFWEIEEIFPNKALSEEEKLCEEHFLQNTSRLSNGRFVVKIPFKKFLENLGESREQARKRFLSLEKKLNENSKLKSLYSDFMAEYESLGHMNKINEDETVKYSFYLPHQGVMREDSVSTKLRVVFDASASTSSQYSLNDLQMVGPTIQRELFL